MEAGEAIYASEAPAFIMEEYKRLCVEIDFCLKESTACVNYSAAANGAFWAWWAASPTWIAKSVVLGIPPVLTTVWAFRWWSLQSAMAGIGKYLAKSECLFLKGEHGWETHLNAEKNRAAVSSKGQWVAAYFVLLIVANLAFAIAAFAFAPVDDKAGSKNLVPAIERLIDALANSQPQPPNAANTLDDKKAIQSSGQNVQGAPFQTSSTSGAPMTPGSVPPKP